MKLTNLDTIKQLDCISAAPNCWILYIYGLDQFDFAMFKTPSTTNCTGLQQLISTAALNGLGASRKTSSCPLFGLQISQQKWTRSLAWQ